MLVKGLFEVALDSAVMGDLRRRIEGGGFLRLDSVASAARPFLVAVLAELFPHRTILVVTDGQKTQEQFAQDLSAFARLGGLPEPLFFPAWENLPHEAILPNVEIVADRLRVLKALTLALSHHGGRGEFLSNDLRGRPANYSLSRAAGEGQGEGRYRIIIVTSIQAMMHKTLAPDLLRNQTLSLRRGAKTNLEELATRIVALGFERTVKVEQKGEFAVRGGIVDVFPVEQSRPIRLEFFGEELESLRWFDPVTQVSLHNETSPEDCELAAVNEWSFLREHPDRSVPFTSWLPAGTMVVLDESARLVDKAEAYGKQMVPEERLFLSAKEFFDAARAVPDAHVISLEEESVAAVSATADRYDRRGSGEEVGDARRAPLQVPLQMHSLETVRPMGEGMIAETHRKLFLTHLQAWTTEGYALYVFCNNEGERQRFEEVLADYGMQNLPARFQIAQISQGFIFPAAKLVVVSDAEIFGRYKQIRPRRLRATLAPGLVTQRIADYSELTEGDFVVHIQHGIGKYLGLRELEVGPAKQEVLAIEYAPTEEGQPPPKLYVPVDQAHLVSKYIGFGKALPILDRLGSARWLKRKAEVEQAIRDLAGGLLEIQAVRAALAGHVFSADTPWQREMEAAFIYEETPDQLAAIQEVKADLESRRPMDRLICGDVGYGKTEVAIRAAFKVVMDDKQVAVLVPTTILAQQHFNTFSERMADYPVRIEMLSRFRTRVEQRAVVRGLREGSVDIVIGTHRLLQSDIVFKDLGLVIIDEEQRFGVLHKEKFKQLRRLVDVLTMTATPIPRTLYLSLTGARDMSTIETPPHDRLPVQTIVCGYDERIIRDAIRRELAREGQVYFLHNRVESIERVRDRLAELVPEARVEIGHGQMDEDDLEEVMKRFVDGRVDVLLCTSIIESGLDIPNANTIIIDRADRLGLADLYQLRGRVGRYKHQAYAYLLLPRHAHLLDTARKRLGAIKQYAQLGAGFKVAMRDLEIRGAGNILGAEQSGHIAAIGFELYCQLLKESIARLKGEAVRPRLAVTVRLDFLAFGSSTAEEGQTPVHIPFSYIADSRQRIEIYRKMAQCTGKREVDRLRAELRDRFGPLPLPVTLLLQVAELKILCAASSVTNLETCGDKVMIQRGGGYLMWDGRFPRLTARHAVTRLAEMKKLVSALR